MNYPYQNYGGYQGGYQQPMYNMPAVASYNVPTANSNGIIWVQGEEGAKAYMVAAGNSVLLMDSEGSSFYIKSTDQSGMPQPLRVFDYVERSTQKLPPVEAQPVIQDPIDTSKFVTREEFDYLKSQLDAIAAASSKPQQQQQERNNNRK